MKSKIFNFLILFLITSCGGGGGTNNFTNPGDVSAFNPSIDSFTSSSYSLIVGGSVNLTWSTTNAISCTASGDWTGDKTNSDSPYNITLNQVKTYVFTLTCRGEDPTNTVYEIIEVVVLSEDDSSLGIYSEDKSSYCATPSNNSSSYWIEDFSSNVLDDQIFTYQEGNGYCRIKDCPNGDDDWEEGWGNHEKQFYTSCRDGYSKNCNSETNTTENAFIEDGFLKIQPIYNNTNPFADPYCAEGNCNYSWDFTSARIITSGKKVISPGSEITVCFKYPEANVGHWPAIWMLPQGFIEYEKSWPIDGENDLAEHMYNHGPADTQSTIHFQTDHLWKIKTVPQNVNFVDKFHSVTMRWEIDKIEYFLDTHNEPYFSIIKSNQAEFNGGTYWPFNEDFYLIFNVASGGTNGGDPIENRFCQNIECSNKDDKDKGRLLIDYIEIKSID
jgi:hypothetical protein